MLLTRLRREFWPLHVCEDVDIDLYAESSSSDEEVVEKEQGKDDDVVMVKEEKKAPPKAKKPRVSVSAKRTRKEAKASEAPKAKKPLPLPRSPPPPPSASKAQVMQQQEDRSSHQGNKDDHVGMKSFFNVPISKIVIFFVFLRSVSVRKRNRSPKAADTPSERAAAPALSGGQSRKSSRMDSHDPSLAADSVAVRNDHDLSSGRMTMRDAFEWLKTRPGFVEYALDETLISGCIKACENAGVNMLSTFWLLKQDPESYAEFEKDLNIAHKMLLNSLFTKSKDAAKKV